MRLKKSNPTRGLDFSHADCAIALALSALAWPAACVVPVESACFKDGLVEPAVRVLSDDKRALSGQDYNCELGVNAIQLDDWERP